MLETMVGPMKLLSVLYITISSVSDAFTALSQPQTFAHLRVRPATSSASSNIRVKLSLNSSKTISAKTTAEQTKDIGGIPDFSQSTQPLDEAGIFTNGDDEKATTWQESLEILLAPDTPVAERQIVLSDLLNSGHEIEESLRTALRERKVSPSIFLVFKVTICFHIIISPFIM